MQQSAANRKEAEVEAEVEAEAAKQAAALVELSQRLFEYAMEDQWDRVAEAYKEKPESHMVKITEAEDTALHLAVSGGKLDFVYKMVENLGENASNVLKAKNNKGNTPLHIAATLGNARMCHCLASKDPNLIAERNHKKETPFYMAAQFGHKDAFLCLYFCYQGNRSDILSRDEDRNTILHAAIAGENFETCSFGGSRFLSYINHKNKKSNSITDEENPQGSSKITQGESSSSQTKPKSKNSIGAVKVSSTRTGTSLEAKEDREDESRPAEKHRQLYHPAIYATFIQFLKFVMKFLLAAFGPGFQWIRQTTTKKQRHTQGTSKITRGESSSSRIKPESNNSIGAAKVSSGTCTSPEAKKDRKDESHPAEENRQQHLPDNYATFIQFFKFMMKLLFVILGLGFQRIKRITTKKQRHKWASQVMNKLIDNTSMYKYYKGRSGSGNGGMAEDFPCNPSLMMSSSHQDTDTLNKQGECQNKTDSSKKEGNDAMVEKLPEEYHVTGSVDSKTLKHAVQMKFEKKIACESTKLGTPSPILIAASKGITEMVDKILEKFPVAIRDVDAQNKNVVLLAVENRQTHTFQFLIERKFLHGSVVRHCDDQGNNALHLAARCGHHRPWLIPGSALQMQWELKWYKFVKKATEKYVLAPYNKKGQTPKQIFTNTHKPLVKEGSEWLTKTSESCSVVAALIATVAFATGTSVPGGVDQHGKPVLRDKFAFGVFAISSLVALCSSITALVFFLAILTSRFEEKDFAEKLPRKLIFGLTYVFASIAAMLVSFCAGHFFQLRDQLKFAAFPIYTVTCLPLSYFAFSQLPLYFDLLRAIFRKVPQRSDKDLFPENLP